MSSISKNYIYNIALTLSTLLINLAIFPYISRVLGVESLGRVGFVTTVIAYFSLFAVLGIKTLGIREIAACGGSRNERSQAFSSMLVLLSITTFVILLIYLISIFEIPRFCKEKELLLLGSLSLIFTSYLIEWFYQGLEEFKFITIRNVSVKIIFAILVLLLIKDSEDIYLYFLLTVAVIMINASVNILYSRKFVDFTFKELNWRKYLSPNISLGGYGIMISMYTSFNVIYLGFVCPDSEVGYYYTATKIYSIIIAFFSAFTGVMIPRMSALVSEKNKDVFSCNLSKSLDIVLAFSVPIVVFFIVFAPHVISLLSGAGYEGAVTPMRIVMPIVFLSSLAQICVLQVLIPLKKDKIVFYGSIMGAITGVVANFLIVSSLGAIGSAVVLLLSEFIGNIMGFIYAICHGYLRFPMEKLIRNILYVLPYSLCCFAAKLMFCSMVFSVLAGSLFSIFCFIILNCVFFKKTYVFEYINHYFNKHVNKITNVVRQ